MTRQTSIRFLKSIVLIGVYGGLLMPLVFIPIVIFPFVFSKLIFFQVLIGLTFPAYVILAWIEPRYRPKGHLLYFAIVAYFVALLLSVIFAVDPMRAWWGNQERMNGLFTLLHFLIWLTMVTSVLTQWIDWRRLLNYQVVLSAFMAIVALLQKIYPALLLFPAGPRVGGLLDNPIYMGAYQIFNLAFLVLLTLKTRSRSARVFYAVIALFDIAAFLAAQSRGSLVGLGVGILLFGMFYGLFTKNKRARYGVWGAVIALFVAYGLLFAFRDTAFVKNSGFYRLTNFSGSVSTRLIAWDIAWKGFLERPLVGWGFDNFHILFNEKYNPHSLRFGTYETWFDRSHNTILDVLSMTGAIGLLTFLGIFAAIFLSLWKAFRKGWMDLPTTAVLFALPIAYFVQNLFVFDHPAAFSMSYLLFGLVIAATRPEFLHHTDAKPNIVSATPKPMPWISFGILQLVVLILVWRASILPFQASRFAIQANNQFGSDMGFERAKTAAAIWSPYLDEQTFLLSRNLITVASQGALSRVAHVQDQYTLVKRLTEEEIRRHPRNTHTHFIYAQLATVMAQTSGSEIKLAEQEYLAGIETSPKRQQLYYGLANLYAQTGRLPQAMELYKKVRDFDLDLGEGHWMYGLALFYDQHNLQEGAKEIALSQTSLYAYGLQNARELIPLTEAYLASGDDKNLKKLVTRLPDIPATSPNFYAQLAYKFQQANLFAERDQVIAYAEKIDPAVRTEFLKIAPGTITPASAAPAPPAGNSNPSPAPKGSQGPRR